jgi:hypothetical protein
VDVKNENAPNRSPRNSGEKLTISDLESKSLPGLILDGHDPKRNSSERPVEMNGRWRRTDATVESPS